MLLQLFLIPNLKMNNGDVKFCEENENITGKCLSMCPKDEILVREKTKRLAVFEIVPGTEKDRIPKAQYDLCVKEYSRSAAGCKIDPSKLRPAHVLLKCMNYLVDEIIDQSKHGKSWIDIYDFVSDRVRAIRQDMIVQRIDSDVVVDILKKAVRFHVVIMEECKLEESFDRASCLDQLHGCLMPLMVHLGTVLPASMLDEFQLYYILLNMKSKNIILNSIRDTLLRKHDKHKQVIVEFAMEFVIFNYHKLFKIFEKLPYIASCCLVTNVDSLRIRALSVIHKAYSSKNSKLPLHALTKWLKFDSNEDTRTFCEMTGLITDNQSVFMNKALPSDFQEVEGLKNRANWRLIGIKKFKNVHDYVKEGDKF